MSEKQEMIQRMLELQGKFIELEHEKGVSGKDFFTAEEGTFLRQYRDEYQTLADKVINLAHAEAGSIRD
ncbi:MAG: hypothetical protein KDH88_06765 [Chromatiales bacterium]|nr:hypothetical protein [Chromatiales bacterium]